MPSVADYRQELYYLLRFVFVVNFEYVFNRNKLFYCFYCFTVFLNFLQKTLVWIYFELHNNASLFFSTCLLFDNLINIIMQASLLSCCGGERTGQAAATKESDRSNDHQPY
jgi:hypothetical protein